MAALCLENPTAACGFKLFLDPSKYPKGPSNSIAYADILLGPTYL